MDKIGGLINELIQLQEDYKKTAAYAYDQILKYENHLKDVHKGNVEECTSSKACMAVFRMEDYKRYMKTFLDELVEISNQVFNEKE
jgi:hypothetical protein